MYPVEDSAQVVAGYRRAGWLRVGRNVILLGLVSLFTDVSSEMVATILPLYLVYTLGLSPTQFGVVDGLYQGSAALVRVAAGFTGDRLRRHKEVAGVGYLLSALVKPLFLAAGSASAVGGLVLADRIGKGIRTAPRDALISLSAPRAELGTAFGVHRALDTTGAMLGPLVAFVLLALAPRAYDAVFVVSFFVALVGLAILFLFVERPVDAEPLERQDVSVRGAAMLLGARHFRTLVVVAAVLGLTTISDGFLYLNLQRRLDFDPAFFPLLYVGTALVYMLLAIPVGRLADRVGRLRVFVAGYGVLLAAYLALLLPTVGPAQALPYLLLLGCYYAATDGVLMAIASSYLPPSLRGSGLALLVTATSLARLLSSVVFGIVWASLGVNVAVVLFSAALLAALTLSAAALRRMREAAADG